jgi:hypothetical protein
MSEQEMTITNKMLIDKLRELNVEEVTIDFHGSGDSGDTESMIVTPEIEIPNNIRDKIESLQQSQDSCLGLDWWNNEGGYGKFRLDVKSGIAETTVTQNDTEDGVTTENLKCENDEFLNDAYANGVETITAEFSGAYGGQLNSFESFPVSNVVNRESI